MKRRLFLSSLSLIIVLLLIAPCWGLDQIIEKKAFSLKEFTLVNGKKISPVQIGYETYGTLAPTKDNVILICHFYSGNSHAAGKYSAEEKDSGVLGCDYWARKAIRYQQVFYRKLRYTMQYESQKPYGYHDWPGFD